MDMGSIAAVAATLKATKELAGAALELARDASITDKLNQVVRQVADVQGALLEIQGQHFATLQEKHDLEERLRQAERELQRLRDATAALDRYELVEVAPQSYLYRLKEGEGVPQHFACPNCFAEGGVRILQIYTTQRHFHLVCKKCDQRFVGPSNPDYREPQPRSGRSSLMVRRI
jgi:anion-transporting  ArsA/GET3 family ATPase